MESKARRKADARALREKLVFKRQWAGQMFVTKEVVKLLKNLQGGPLQVINGVVTSLSRVITPVTYLFSAIYSGYNTIYNW